MCDGRLQARVRCTRAHQPANSIRSLEQVCGNADRSASIEDSPERGSRARYSKPEHERQSRVVRDEAGILEQTAKLIRSTGALGFPGLSTMLSHQANLSPAFNGMSGCISAPELPNRRTPSRFLDPCRPSVRSVALASPSATAPVRWIIAVGVAGSDRGVKVAAGVDPVPCSLGAARKPECIIGENPIISTRYFYELI